VPSLLKDISNWVGWKSIVREGKPEKLPFDVKTSRMAKADDSSTWASFDQVLAATDILNGSDYDGPGFELGGTNIAGIDFDNAIGPVGKIDPYALAILELLGSPYTEISPSGKGLHAFVECDRLPDGGRKLSKGHDGIEIYHGKEGGRYFTITGERIQGDGIPKIADISLPYLLITQNHDRRFKSLWLGDVTANDSDDSSADFALMTRLAKLTQNDPVKMEKFFSASKLGQRDKWTDRADYRQRTIKAAISGELTKSTKGTGAPQGATHAIERIGNTIKPKRLKWLWEDRVPLGKITLFAGNPDNGKSIAVMSVAAICSTGRPFPNGVLNSVPPSDVLWLIGEDDLDDTAIPRLIAADADMSKMHFLEGVERPNTGEDEIRLDLDMAAIEAKLQEWPNLRLIVIDPISNYLGDVSMVAEQDARRVLIPLKKLAARYNVSIIIVMHLNKKSDLDAISRVGGAMAFIGVARCSWAFVRDAAAEDGKLKNSFSMSRLKNNLTASGVGLSYRIEAQSIPLSESETMLAPAVVWGDVINTTADEALGHRREIGRPTGSDSKVQEAIQFLETALQNGPKHRKELETEAHEAAGITPRTLRRAQKQLGIKPDGKGKDWVWALPENPAADETGSADNITPVQSSLIEAAS